MSDPTTPKPAHPMTAKANRAFADGLDFTDTRDFERAQRGFVGTLDDGVIMGADGAPSWDLTSYAFLDDDDAPDTVNPSLWRQARLNMHHGLYKVAERVYQVRGLDLANMTIIEGDTGLIIFDTLTACEAAAAALDLYYRHRPKRPVVAMIYSHSHIDHYGGVKGVISQDDVDQGRVTVIAPDGFMEAVSDEGVHSSNASSRRALFQFGIALQRGPRGQVDAGLGKNVARGTFSLIAPTQLIMEDTETHVIDGVEMVFQMAPESEAPAEMHMYLPQFRILNLAENSVHNLHNFLPLRGTVVRDPRLWSGYIDDALEMYGRRSDILIGQHHWPIWGQDDIVVYLQNQRDLYKHIHDQTLRLMNHGFKPAEIAEQITHPPGLAQDWALREYYGTIRHNAKAVYQRYLGWYDANPVNLDPHPPIEEARRAVRYMGGADALLIKARADFDAGDFRWVAQVAGQLVLAEPDNQAARALAADAMEQMGYQTESATWRNAYLFAAQELRHGVNKAGPRPRLGPDMMEAIGTRTLFDYLALRLNPERAGDAASRTIWQITDTGQRIALSLRNQTLTYRDTDGDDGIAVVSLARPVLANLVLGARSLDDLLAEGAMVIDGDSAAISALFGMLDQFDYMFDIVTPHAAPEVG
ncbi:MAG: MBL fold metallo-hydrolase [Marinibacterium sp.]|nr:MBL fold metallo-hydrolase [Marinibacterium sp.]